MSEVAEPLVTTPVDDGGYAAEIERVSNAAQEFIDARLETEPGAATAPQRQRDEHGRFVSAKGEPETTAATEPVAATTEPTVDPLLVESAKEAGLSDAIIAQCKTEDEFIAAIENHELAKANEYCKYLGIDPTEFVAWQQSRNQSQTPAQQPTPQVTQPVTPSVVDEPIPELTEEEFSPEQIAKLKPLITKLGRLEAGQTAMQKLQSEVEALKAQDKQRAEAARQAQLEAQWAQSWDQIAVKVPGFVEYFGKPSELKRLQDTNPNHPKVLDYATLDAHYRSAFQRWSRIPNITEEKLIEKSLQSAWSASPYSKLNGHANGTNGHANGQQGVVRHGPRRIESAPPPAHGDDLDAELKAIGEKLGIAWDNAGGNPFSSPRA